MLLTRNRSDVWKAALFVLVGLVFIGLPRLLELVGFTFTFGPLVAWVPGGLIVLLGLAGIVAGLSREQLSVSERGLNLRVAGLRDVDLPWTEVEAVTIELHRMLPEAPAVLVLVPTADSPLAGRAGYESRLGGEGIVLVRVAELAQGHSGVVQAMNRYAAGRFTDLVRERSGR